MLNILIVDDSATMRSIVARVLRLAAVPVENLYFAENGERGLEILKACPVDLVMVDINMPVMDGCEMLERMKADTGLSDIPAIVVSTEGSESRISKLKSLGISAFVRKPFDRDALAGTINKLLGGEIAGRSRAGASHIMN